VFRPDEPGRDHEKTPICPLSLITEDNDYQIQREENSAQGISQVPGGEWSDLLSRRTRFRYRENLVYVRILQYLFDAARPVNLGLGHSIRRTEAKVHPLIA